MPELANPTIALGVNTASPAASQNPLGLIGTIAQAQKSMVEARSATLTLQGREMAGKIIAGAASPEAAESALLANPLTAAFAPEYANNIAAMRQTQTTTQGLVQDQSQSAMQKVFALMGASATDPKTALESGRAIIESMPNPQAKALAEKSFGMILDSVAGGLDGLSPEERTAKITQRLGGIAVATGATTPEAERAQSGNVAPSITMQPVGPGGAPVPVAAGGPAVGPQPAPHIIGQSEAPVQGLTPEQTAEQAATGTIAGDVEKQMSESAGILPVEAKRLNLMQDMLQLFQAGGGAETRGEIGRSIQALKNLGFTGITDEMIKKVANGDLDALQFFNQQIKQAAIGQLKDVQKGLGRASAMEINNAIDALSADQDPAALMRALNQAKYGLQVQYDQMGKWLQFKKLLATKDPSVAGLDKGDFNNWYLANSNDSALPTKTGSGIELGPRPLTSAKGVAAPAAAPSISDLLKKYGKAE